jgi:hypothetical protein
MGFFKDMFKGAVAKNEAEKEEPEAKQEYDFLNYTYGAFYESDKLIILNLTEAPTEQVEYLINEGWFIGGVTSSMYSSTYMYLFKPVINLNKPDGEDSA